ncbi:EAL domain-containing protein [Marinobacter salicampi]|uniref:EAL domain-containing protein n=1 Tax=Marinobacter salicampi TaxID=435907 RepID=UPI00140BFD17|nr:EAL domain-containing protein [Marinobacter salicampi]
MREFFIRRYRADTGQADTRRTLVRVDDGGRIIYADSQAEAVLGYSSADLSGRPLACIIADRQDDPLSPSHRHQFEQGKAVLLTLKHREGFFFTAHLSLRLAIRDADQAASAFIALRDSTALDPRLTRLAEDAGELGFWELDIQDNRMTWTEGLYQVLELKPGIEITPEQALFYCQRGQNRLRALFRRCARTGQPFSIRLELLTSRQRLRQVELHGKALRNGLQVVGLGGVLIDQTANQQLEQSRRQAVHLMQGLMAATEDLVVAVDRDLNLICFNEAFRRQARVTFDLNVTEGANLNQLLADFPNERRLVARLWQRAFERDSYVVEMPLAQQERELPVYEIHYQRLLNDYGEVTGAVHVARDITSRVKNSGNRYYMNRHDPVTGLLNRREFMVRLERLHRNTRTTPGNHALLYLNLDHFAVFREQAGSGASDRYLRALAGELTVKIRQRDSLARLSGDTFAVLIENCNRHEALKVAEGLLEFVSGFAFEWQGKTLQTSASAGLLRLAGTTPGDPERLLYQAGDLCHTAKIAGRGRVHAADAVAQEMQESVARERLEVLQECLDNDRLSLQFQSLRPVASVTWGDHIEILARLQPDDDGTLLHPADFMPIAERFDLTRDVDRAVIRKTLAWLGEHSLMEPRLKYCGFNLSLASVMDDSFPEFVETLLQDSPFAPSCFCFEVRESSATQYPDEVAVLCDALHKIGCRIALDGAGASVESYSLAARLPVDIIKLDQGMMSHLHDDPVQQVMVEALHRIAEAAGKLTIATFIENDEAMRKVRGLGIHYGQGFRLSRPRPLAELTPVAVELDTGRIGGRPD